MNEVHRARKCNSQMSSALYCTPSAKVRNSVANVRVTSQPGGRCCFKVAWAWRRQTVELPVPGESRAIRKLTNPTGLQCGRKRNVMPTYRDKFTDNRTAWCSISTPAAHIRRMDFRNPYRCPHLSSVP